MQKSIRTQIHEAVSEGRGDEAQQLLEKLDQPEKRVFYDWFLVALVLPATDEQHLQAMDVLQSKLSPEIWDRDGETHVFARWLLFAEAAKIPEHVSAGLENLLPYVKKYVKDLNKAEEKLQPEKFEMLRAMMNESSAVNS